MGTSDYAAPETGMAGILEEAEQPQLSQLDLGLKRASLVAKKTMESTKVITAGHFILLYTNLLSFAS